MTSIPASGLPPTEIRRLTSARIVSSIPSSSAADSRAGVDASVIESPIITTSRPAVCSIGLRSTAGAPGGIVPEKFGPDPSVVPPSSPHPASVLPRATRHGRAEVRRAPGGGSHPVHSGGPTGPSGCRVTDLGGRAGRARVPARTIEWPGVPRFRQMDTEAPALTEPVTPARRPLDVATALIRRMSVWHWALAAAITWYTIHFTRFTLDIHHGLGTSNYDLGLYDQGIWLMSRFKAPFVTLMGRNLMGDHSSFILVVPGPAVLAVPCGRHPAVRSVGGDRGRGDPGVPVREAPAGVGLDGLPVLDDVPAPPGGDGHEHGELPSRRVPRGARRLRDLRRARAEVAAVRRVRRALADGQGGRLARGRPPRRVGRAAPGPAHRTDHGGREPRLHGHRDARRDARPHRGLDAEHVADSVRRANRIHPADVQSPR